MRVLASRFTRRPTRTLSPRAVFKMIKVNDTIIFSASGYANAETVGVVDGCTVFVPQMIAGETARVRVNYVKKNVAYGAVVELLEKSKKRVAPPCPHFGKCGGCALMHVSYDEQLSIKQNKVAANLKKIGKLDVDVLPCVPSGKTFGYRNKLSLPVSGTRGNVRVGMYERNSHRVVDTRGCSLGGDWATTLVTLFTQYCNEQKITPYNEKDFTGEVRHLVARFVENQLLVTVVSNGEFAKNLTPFADLLSKHFKKFGLFVNINDYKNNVILGKTTRHICGIEYIEGTHLGVKFRLRASSFFQVNDGVKDAIYAKVRELLDVSKTEILVDCFSGIGILTNVLASENFDIYAIEIEPSAVKDACEMAQLNTSPRVHNICGDVNVELPKIIEANTGKRFTIVVDPPRKGLGAGICETLAKSNADNVVYISCDSATLARDLAQLADAYAVTYVQPFDMFPHTDQVETLVCLERKLI